ncbi:O-fucosyltransferase 36-like [Actinidia eriantha]|uniref:O-fucosyltransferase 36-like n=1 Tax=Actinidia eriantha TaxID=165200 RepID=UPI00258E6F54|nr:O-fucosyltransferase 36-like [Actinidia eriantha]
MDRESSSDEEEDRRNLIDQNERHGTKSPKHSTFHMDDDNEFKDRIGNARRLGLPRFAFNKRYLFAIFLPIFIVVVYFTTDIRSLFQTSVSNVTFDSSDSRMRESELRALYLLRQQQLGLFKLWNHSFVNEANFDFSSNPNSTVASSVNSTSSFTNSSPVSHDRFSARSLSALLEDLKAAVLSQMSLNKQIQQILLSTHQSGNYPDLGDNVTDPSISGYASLDRCRKVDQKLSERKKIEWKPKSNKYLFAICVSGQMSNHLICLEKHMFFAALLNRVLVIPSSKVDYQFNHVLDIDHINKCLGRKVVVTFEEFAEAKKKHLHIDKFVCYFSLPQLCFMDDERVKKLKSLGISMNKLEPAWVEDVKKPTKRTMQDVMAKFSSNDDVIAIGDVFFAEVEQDLVMQPGGPLAHKCKTLIEPSRLIMLTAQRFIQTFLGERFIALHFRRHGFLKFCNAKKPSCFFPIPQAADCIVQVAERANAPVIYLSTDAAESETSLLQSLVVLNGKAVPLVKRPARNSAEKWDALLYRHGLEEDSQVEAMLDKTICAMSAVFIGSSGSTFTEDILRLRKDWGLASLCDEYICQGQLPNFIADNE